MEFLIPPLFFAVFILASSIKIIKEYERGIVYTLGKYTGTRDAGLRLIIPFIQQMERVDVRIRTEDIP